MKIIFKIVFLLSTGIFWGISISGCVDSVIDDQNTSLKPTITITSPVAGSGNTVHVGLNKIEYSASDYSGGQGLSFLQVILNGDVTTPNYEDVVTNGVLPDLYLDVPRTSLGSTIEYYVIAYNLAGGYNSSSVQKNIPVVEAPPGIPYNLIIVPVNANTGEIRLVWDDDSENVLEYWLYQKIENGIWNRIQVIIAPQKTATVIINPLVDNYFKVAGWNSIVANETELNFSNEVTSATQTSAWNLRAEAIGSSKVILRWDNPWGLAVNVFEIERTSGAVAWDSNPEFYVVGSSNSEITYSDSPLNANTTYAYRVRRRMLADDYRSAWSSPVTIGTSYADVLPPSNFTVALQYLGGSSYLVKMDWDINYSYAMQIERAENNAFPPVYEIIASINAGIDGPMYDNSIIVGKSYFYRARYVLGTNVYSEYTSIHTIP